MVGFLLTFLGRKGRDAQNIQRLSSNSCHIHERLSQHATGYADGTSWERNPIDLWSAGGNIPYDERQVHGFKVIKFVPGLQPGECFPELAAIL